MSIPEYLQKIKPELPDILTVSCIVLICTAAMGLYRIQAQIVQSGEVQVVQATSTAITRIANAEVGDGRPVYASKNGTKYYYSTCAGIKRIKESNLVTFASAGLAISEGYGLANGCK